MRSYFGRINLSWDDKYLLEVNLRADGSSRFAPDKRWGWFPSVSAGWSISEEPFLKKAAGWLDMLKLRVSYGTLGNNATSTFYMYQPLYASANYVLGNAVGQWPGTDHPRQSQSHLGDDAHDQYRSGLRVVCPSFKWFCGCIQQADDRYPDFIAGTVRARHFCCPQPKCRQGTQPGYRFRYQLVRSYQAV